MSVPLLFYDCYNAQKMKFSIKDFFSKCDQICRKLRIWSHLLKKFWMENFIFCAVLLMRLLSYSFIEHCIKDARIRVFTDPYSPVFSHILCSGGKISEICFHKYPYSFKNYLNQCNWMNFHENEISLKRNYEVLRQQVYQSEKSIGTHLLSKTWKSSIPILGAVFNNKDSRSTWASKMTVQMSDSIMIFYGNSSTVSFCWHEWIARFSVVVCHN